MSAHPEPDPVGPGQESVWDYPRPPRLELSPHPIEMIFEGRRLAFSERALRVLETSHPPTYYLPLDAFAPGALVPASGSSFCEWKGAARYFDLVGRERRVERAAWGYPDPTPAFAALADHVGVYLGALDAGYVGGERASPQPGGFYGGWVSPWVAGPFKGGPGSTWW